MMKQLDTSLGLSILICTFLSVVFGDIPGSRVSFHQLSILPNSANQSQNNAYSPVFSSRKNLNSFTLEGDVVIDEILTIRSLGHFDRERIPERVVHAKGSTVYGVFTVTNSEISSYTKASVFNGLGKETRVAVRFSTSLGERGSSDLAFNEVRGMAIKFYTEEGVYDQLCINMPIFFINDPQFFPQLTHAQKRDPRSDLRDANNFWDFFSLHPETLNGVTFFYTDFGLPDGFRHMSSFAINAFRLTSHKGQHSYAKFTWIPNQGVRNLNLSEAMRISGIDPDYGRRDLFEAIEDKRYPSWTLYTQIITVEDIQQHFTYNPFDATKLWPINKFPLVEVGTLKLTSNVKNAFAESEQIAMNPANLVPGIEPSPDRLLRGRLFAYRDTQFYRLGANFLTIPVNREPQGILSERDGSVRTDGNFYDIPNYWPNSYFLDRPNLYGIADSPFVFSMDDIAFLMPDSLQQQYAHARESYRSLTEEQKYYLHHNLAFTLSDITQSAILNRMFKHLKAINPIYAEEVRQEMINQGRSSLVN